MRLLRRRPRQHTGTGSPHSHTGAVFSRDDRCPSTSSRRHRRHIVEPRGDDSYLVVRVSGPWPPRHGQVAIGFAHTGRDLNEGRQFGFSQRGPPVVGYHRHVTLPNENDSVCLLMYSASFCNLGRSSMCTVDLESSVAKGLKVSRRRQCDHMTGLQSTTGRCCVLMSLCLSG